MTPTEAGLPVDDHEADVMHVATDGSGTVFEGQSHADRFIIEVVDPGKRTVTATTSVAELTQAGFDAEMDPMTG